MQHHSRQTHDVLHLAMQGRLRSIDVAYWVFDTIGKRLLMGCLFLAVIVGSAPAIVVALQLFLQARIPLA